MKCHCFSGKGSDTKVRDWHEHLRMGRESFLVGSGLIGFAHLVRLSFSPPFLVHAGVCSFLLHFRFLFCAWFGVWVVTGTRG